MLCLRDSVCSILLLLCGLWTYLAEVCRSILIQVHHQRRGVYLEDIDGPVWLRVPPARVAYSPGAGRLTIECAAVMPVEQTVFSNELILSRATLPMDTPTNLDFSKIVNIHRDTQVLFTLHSLVPLLTQQQQQQQVLAVGGLV